MKTAKDYHSVILICQVHDIEKNAKKNHESYRRVEAFPKFTNGFNLIFQGKLI